MVQLLQEIQADRLAIAGNPFGVLVLEHADGADYSARHQIFFGMYRGGAASALPAKNSWAGLCRLLSFGAANFFWGSAKLEGNVTAMPDLRLWWGKRRFFAILVGCQPPSLGRHERS